MLERRAELSRIVDAQQVQTRPERDACEPSVETETLIRATTTRRISLHCKMEASEAESARACRRENRGVIKSTPLRAPADSSVMLSQDTLAALLRSSCSFQSHGAPCCWFFSYNNHFPEAEPVKLTLICFLSGFFE